MAKKQYIIPITDGVGTEQILKDTYNITADINGYDNVSISPATITVSEGVDVYNFTIASTGTLTLHVTEEGSFGGTAVVGAKFIRCDSLGTTYGTEITTDENGDAVFNYVPFNETNAPVIYYKQTASDGEHEYDETLANTTLTISTRTVEIANALPALRTMNLQDANYEGLKIDSGNITLS